MSPQPSSSVSSRSAATHRSSEQELGAEHGLADPGLARGGATNRLACGQQLTLFDFGATGGGEGQPFRDPAFVDNKSLPVHRWTPWIAGFSAPFVDDVLDAYLNGTKRRTPRVLDPFAGVGTTLVQSILRGYDAVGVEINPYAALAARTKTEAPTLDLRRLDAVCQEMTNQARTWRFSPPPADVNPPPMKTRIPFFSEGVERQVLHAVAFIRSISQQDVADVFRLAFGAVLVGVSNYTYEPSLGTRPGAGKPLVEDADVWHALTRKLAEIRADIEWLQRSKTRRAQVGKAQVYNKDFFTAARELETGAIDLMVTSPPYMNNYHYVRNTRPQLYWLDFIHSPAEQKHLETGNFGKYWQTVRDRTLIPLEFPDPALEERLQQLREVRAEKGAYGGPGWANYVAAYLNDCRRFLFELRRLLRRRGVGVIVIGNSIIQGIEFKVEEILAKLGESAGLHHEGTHVLRTKRVGASITTSSVRRGQTSKAILYESVVVLRKR